MLYTSKRRSRSIITEKPGISNGYPFRGSVLNFNRVVCSVVYFIATRATRRAKNAISSNFTIYHLALFVWRADEDNLIFDT